MRGKIRELGNVNVGAIEEYREVKERYDFLHTQVSDVEKSRGELLRMISELSGEMREIFTASFKTINENFGRIFREMFGGGDAHLELSDPDNVLESGIDITGRRSSPEFSKGMHSSCACVCVSSYSSHSLAEA